MDDLEFRIAKLDVKPNDVLVVRTRHHLSTEQRQRVTEIFKKLVPEVRAIVMDPEVELAILSPVEVADDGTVLRVAEAA